MSTERLEGNAWAGMSMKNEMCSLTHKNAGGVGYQWAVLGHDIALSLGEVNEILA